MLPNGRWCLSRRLLSTRHRAREDLHRAPPPARSALTLRPVPACFGPVICSLSAAAFVVTADVPVFAGLLAFLAAVADIVVVARRKLRGEPG